MIMTGQFHITLSPAANEQAFVAHMTDVVFKDPSALQLVRNGRGMQHELLKGGGPVPSYTWQVRIDLINDQEYDFARNLERVQQAVDGSGVVSGLDVYVNVGGA